MPDGADMQPATRPTSGWIADGAHHLPVRVYYEDTDAVGIIYHANYLRFAERARSEMLRLAGIDRRRMAEQGLSFVVRHVDMDFRAPARLDDALEIVSRNFQLGGASLRLDQVVRHNGADIVVINLTLVCINDAGRAVRVPDFVRDAVARVQSSGPLGRSS